LKKTMLMAILVIAGCGDAVDSYYATYNDAVKEKLFSRGWLPEILPESVVEIRVSNDLDHNTSAGSFMLAKADIKEFVSQLRKNDTDGNSFHYQSNQAVWVFTIEDSGLVNYRLSGNS
jgi:hypothetical protein